MSLQSSEKRSFSYMSAVDFRSRVCGSSGNVVVPSIIVMTWSNTFEVSSLYSDNGNCLRKSARPTLLSYPRNQNVSTGSLEYLSRWSLLRHVKNRRRASTNHLGFQEGIRRASVAAVVAVNYCNVQCGVMREVARFSEQGGLCIQEHPKHYQYQVWQTLSFHSDQHRSWGIFLPWYWNCTGLRQ